MSGTHNFCPDATKHYPDIEAGWADTPVDRPPLPRRAQLNEAARFKHIGPMCRSKRDAEQKSVDRNSKYPQEVGEINTVFQVALERSKNDRRNSGGTLRQKFNHIDF